MRRAWNRMKKYSQHNMGKKKYMIFNGSEQNFIKNGAFVLEESISLFHGKANPIRHFTVDDLNNMNVEERPCYREGFYYLHRGTWEERVVLVKKSHGFRPKGILLEIVVATQMATHNNVHKILGCCLETESPVLVFEWVPIETLQDRIDQNQNKPVLEWKDRLRIAWKIAHVVTYLHTAFPRPVILRNLKPSNVFLDQDGAAKLYDFSYSEPIPEGQEFVVPYRRCLGTFGGFLAPEFIDKKVSKSTDVYSFGVFLLVLLTGKNPGDEHFVINCEEDLYNGIKNKCINKIVDPAITGNGVTTIEDLQLKAFTQLAFRCVIIEEGCRPSMVEVATELKNMIKSLEGGGIYRFFEGNCENFTLNESLVLEETMSLFHGNADHIRYFSVDELNSMNVEFWHNNSNMYQGSWEGRLVLVKLPDSVLKGLKSSVKLPERMLEGLKSSIEIQLRLIREIVVASQIATHNNVHKLLGCCLETKFPVLVYEWVAAETLKDHILLNDENRNKLPLLEWKDRLRIAWEISCAVSYFHTAFQRPIIHGYLEPSSVFIDKDNTVKLSNFNLSAPIPEGQDFVVDYFEKETIQYEAPESLNHRYYTEMTEYTDVYSFGVFLLVLLTGNDVSFSCKRIINWVAEKFRMKCISDIVDPAIAKNGVTTIEDLQLKAFTQLALRCVILEEGCRPSMVEVATELKNMIKSPEGGGIYRFFQGNSENFTQNESLVLKESMSVFHGNADHIRYFSVDELNSMNVEFWHNNSNLYQGSWEGRVVLVKLPESVLEGQKSPIKIQLRLIREIVVASQIATHNNVHKLLGCCLETKFPVLVYEWVAAETLKDRLLLKDGNRNKLPLLEWKDRLMIAWEISYAVSYFHSVFPRPIIHGYLEPNSVFLDKDNTVKLSNFTRSASIPEGQDFVVDYFEKETMEYEAPGNYWNYTEMTEYTDVYSFGVFFLVLLTGKDVSFSSTSYAESFSSTCSAENVKSTNIIDWVAEKFRMKCISDIVDPAIAKNGLTTAELSASIDLALRCTATKANRRPIMVDVAHELYDMIKSSVPPIPTTSSGVYFHLFVALMCSKN